jgi:hypothetical protein
MIWLWLVVPAAAWVGILIFDFVEGKTYLHDRWDEWRLVRSDLEEMDRAWAENPNRSDVVFSLTTIPSRLEHIDSTLMTLLRQTRAPAAIRLNVPKWSKREKTAYEVPERIRSLKAITIVECEDYGPATKLIPSVLGLEPDQKIIVVDDDRHYPENLLSDLESASNENPDAAFGFCGWIVPEDLVHRPANAYTILFIKPPAPILARRIRRQHAIDIVRGVSGYLVKPRFFDPDALVDYSEAPENVFFVDDVWISAHCRAPKFVVPARRSNYAPRLNRNLYHETSLGWINSAGAKVEQRNNSIAIQHFADVWKVGGRRSSENA